MLFHARAKLQRKGCDLLVVNAVGNGRAFEVDVNDGWLLAAELFEFAYRPSPWLFLLGCVSATLLVVGSGWIGNRSVLSTPPVRILRSGG